MRGPLYDDDHRRVVVDPTTQVERSGQKKVSVSEDSVVDLLETAIRILRKIEYHVSIGSDTELDNDDIDS